jgi:D-alanyl-D-alanine carboxypeptidase/D-alanyl-D-alanine-endopeptidase (penicillin-binding protein 4)
MKTVNLFICLLVSIFSIGQDIEKRLATAIKGLEADPQFKHAILSMYVVDSKTGKVMYDKNSQVGLAPASCQKVVISVSAFEILGKDFHYTTYIGTDPAGDNSFDAGSLFIIGQGDPTFGSWRWKNTTDSVVLLKIASVLKKNKLNRFERNLYIEDTYYGLQTLPDGWIWQDIGNYYGAACFGFNWHENQYDLVLQPGQNEGWPATIISTHPTLQDFNFTNTITTGPKGSADNGYIYTSPYSSFAITKGTIPAQEGNFTISGSMSNPSKIFRNILVSYLKKSGITIQPISYSYAENLLSDKPVYKATHYIDSLLSPSLDSINYWFLKKSVNLFGESLLKSIAVKYHPYGLSDRIYDTAIRIVKNFWSDKGIDPSALNIIDGSGLSPANRVTTNALVTVMQYARQQNWFSSFYDALPELNGIKMKDGYINGVRSFTGYVKSNAGAEYTFSFIVNNFDGSAGTIREKMWKLLDILK